MTSLTPKTFRLLGFITMVTTLHAQPLRHVQQRIADGTIEGVVSADGKVRTFKGIPYAAPPVGPLRWKPPQPVTPWTGVRPALDYGPRAMQGRIFDDMVFHDTGPSEDCLYLNVWLPEDQPHAKLPVMVWIHGGGFVAGASSEPRQDGGNLCKLGVIVVSMNYRMGIFGFMAHPELTQESGHHASGNYGLMDIIASLHWVHDNIAAFGGDPDNVTIFGESAGSWAVSALMAAPPARGLFQRAIGESGGFVADPGQSEETRADAEQFAVDFTKSAFGTSSLAALRALPAQKLLDATLKKPRPHFSAIVDGYVLPADGRSIFGTGQQAHVPLLAGWNRDEGNYHSFFGDDDPTLVTYALHAVQHFGDRAARFLKAYAATTDAEAKRAAADWAGDDFIAFGTWKWIDLCRLTGGQPVYRYHFEQTLPLAADAPAGAERIAPHASDIEFIFRTLPSRHLPWGPDERVVSEMMAKYWTNFAKAGNPNGPGLPEWPRYDANDGYQVMHLNAHAAAAPATDRARYEFLDR
ncbi:MAG TPA: carboxylesterase family protein [Opitutus sp.]|nr:carboxylesterase family protein [Opitutus sp.]